MTDRVRRCVAKTLVQLSSLGNKSGAENPVQARERG